MPPLTTPASVLPSPAIREEIGSRLADFIAAIILHPKFQMPFRHPTLVQIWDFAMRTKYILSELDNVEAGLPVQFPDQIPDYDERCVGTPNPEKADELMTDVKTRSISMDLMVRSPDRTIMAKIGLPDMDFGAELGVKAKALTDAIPDI